MMNINASNSLFSSPLSVQRLTILGYRLHKTVIGWFLLFCSCQLSAASFIDTSFAGSQAEALAACEAQAASYGYPGCADPASSVEQGYVYGGNWCDKLELYNGSWVCTGDSHLAIVYFPIYKIGDAYNKNKNTCTVGNPIDPATGTKIQREPLIYVNGVRPLALDLFYNSASLNKWTHTYNRRLTFSDVPTGKRFDLNNLGSANGLNPVAQAEQPSMLGGTVSAYGKLNTAPENTGRVYLTKEEACTTGWKQYRRNYNYSWIESSVAEYHLTPVSTIAGIGQCYILDKVGGSVKMVLNVYDLISGKPAGSSNTGSANIDTYLRFIRESNGAIVFENFGDFSNIQGSGETVEKITDNGVISYRLHTADDTVEEYDSEGYLLSITNAQGYVQTISYIPGTDRIYQIMNQTGESLTFAYESYGDSDQYNRISSITDHTGRVWAFNYDSTYQTLAAIDFPDDKQRQYHYENTNNPQLLTGITDESGIRYVTWAYDADERAELSVHGEAQEKDRVEIVYADNLGKGTRLITKVRKSLLTETIDNIKSTYLTNPAAGSPVVAEITGNNPTKFEYNAMTGNLEYKVKDTGTDFQQRTEYYDYDSKGNPGLVREAVGSSQQRDIRYTYDPRFHSKVSSISEASVYNGAEKLTTYSYDDYANITSINIAGYTPTGEQISRTTRMEYNGPYHQLSLIDGPRTDVNDITTFNYYPDNSINGSNRARLMNVIDAGGNFIRKDITYTPTGKIYTEYRANNLFYGYSYYPGNDRLKSVFEYDSVSAASRITSLVYTQTGQLSKITRAKNSIDEFSLSFSYDDAYRLTRITDDAGNYREFILDSEGNVEQENIYDSQGYLKKTLTQTFDLYNRLNSFNEKNKQVDRVVNPDGTLAQSTDSKGVTTAYSYDNLKRLTRITQDQNGSDPTTANAITQYAYNTQDKLISVTDANNGETTYQYDDLGNQLSKISPDSGTTTYTYDEAGNIATRTDAKQQLFSYSYDAKNRLLSIDAPGKNDDVNYVYDNCPQGQGHLCQLKRGKSTTHYSYNAFGDVLSLDQNVITWRGYNSAVNSIAYEYDMAGRLKAMTYPSGAIVTYTYDTTNNIASVLLNQDAVETPLFNVVKRFPFGEINSGSYGNGKNYFYYPHNDYRTWIRSEAGEFSVLNYDGNGNPVSINNNWGSNTLTYDGHDRLKSVTDVSSIFSYDYDLLGNRLSKTVDNVSDNMNYVMQSNRLSGLNGEAVVTDDNGNITKLRGMTLSYTADNRLKGVNTGVAFDYNGLGQRTLKKTVADGYAGDLGYGQSQVYLYGLNGELLAEIGPTGKVVKEYIYMESKPLAMLEHRPDSGEPFLNADLDNDGSISVEDFLIYYFNYSKSTDPAYDVNGDGIKDNTDFQTVVNCGLTPGTCEAASYNTQLYYIHNDDLGTPKLMTDINGTSVWEAYATPFGDASVNEDVDGDGVKVVMNIRQPGQYFDWESGFYYNYFRYYDPGTGRYITSDPIGLRGGINTYSYVYNNPLKYVDPTGEFTALAGAAGGFVAGGLGSFAGTLYAGGSFGDAATAGFEGALTGGSAGFLAGLCGGCAAGVFTGISFDLLVNGATGAKIVNDTNGAERDTDSKACQQLIWPQKSSYGSETFFVLLIS